MRVLPLPLYTRCPMAKEAMAPDGRVEDIHLLHGQYWLTRIVFLRCLGFVYAAAFFSALRDNGALLGEDGLLPATRFMSRLEHHFAALAPWEKVLKVPTVFWFTPPTAEHLWWAAAAGAAVSCFVALRGAANFPAMALLWALYHSLVNVGQTWYSFGWESQLLETGFLAMFLVPWLSLSRFPAGSPSSPVCVWGYRWLLFRIMLGAGLIKVRGDACWWDLTCMEHHYQTQPNPNPLSWYLHHLPSAEWHKAEVVANHIVELVLPWCLLLSRSPRCVAGSIQILFQAVLVASGNLSFLNWLTAVPAVFSFDDLHLARLFPRPVLRRLVRGVAAGAAAATPTPTPTQGKGFGGGEVAAVTTAVSAGPPAREGDVVKEGGGGSTSGDGGGERVGGGTAVGSGSGSGSGSRPALRSRPGIARTESTLQWSSESEEEEEESESGNNNADDDTDGIPRASAIASKLAGSSGYGPRDSFHGLRFRGQGGPEKPPRLPSRSPSPSPAPAAGCRGGAVASAAAGSAAAGSAAAAAPASSEGANVASVSSADLGGCGSLWSARCCRALRGARRALRWAADGLVVVLVVKGSVPVVKNMAGVGGGQKMNSSFDSLRIVNSYGNFGSVTKTRGEVVLKGTRHPNPVDPMAEWKEYGFRCKPGDVDRRPCVISPLHYRLDWQVWFAAFQTYRHNPWLVNLVSKLLSREDETRALVGSLLDYDPFSDGSGIDGEEDGGGHPLFIKADLYLYEFTPPRGWFAGAPASTTPEAQERTGSHEDGNGDQQPTRAGETTLSSSSSSSAALGGGGDEDDGREEGVWWTRRFVREYLPPVGLDNPSLRQFLAQHGLA